MDFTQSIGNITELQCICKFIELGYQCSIPYGNSARYDFIVDVNGKLFRIQCKTAKHPTSKRVDEDYDTDSIMISTASTTTNTNRTTRHSYSKDDIDYFATYFNNQVYIIPVEETGMSFTLKLSPCTMKTQHFEGDYRIEKFFPINEHLIISKENFLKRTAPKEKIIYKCCECNNEYVSKKGGICRKCADIKNRVVKDRPSREELKEMIRNMSFVDIGKKYGIADNSIKKWCKTLNLPSRKKDIKAISDEDWVKI